MKRPEWQEEAMAKETGRFFLGLPERWMFNPKWRCKLGHISTSFLKSEEHGDLCLACRNPVNLTFPEDQEK